MNIKHTLMRVAKRKTTSLILFAALGLYAVAAPSIALAQGAVPVEAATTYEVVGVLGAIAGGIVRTVIPYVRKRKEREEAIERGGNGEDGKLLQPLGFGRSFSYTFILAVAGSAAAAIVLLPQTLASIPTGSTLMGALFYAFTFAYTSNDILNEMAAT